MKGLKSILTFVAAGLVATSTIAQKNASASSNKSLKSRLVELMENDTLSYDQYVQRAKTDFDSDRKAAIKRYKDFRDSVMKDYIEALGRPWKNEKSKPAAPKPIDNSVGPLIIPEDVKPDAPKEKPDDEPKKDTKPDAPKKEDPIKQKPRDNGTKMPIGKIKVKDIVELPDISINVKPAPFVPIIIPEDTEEPEEFKFTFFGTEVSVNIDEDSKFKILSNSNQGIATAMQELADNEQYSNLLQQCINMRETYHLCDWAYFQALTELSNAYLGKGSDEATMLTGYLFCMSGYKVRYAFDTAGKLYNMIACDQYIVDIPYITLSSDKYTRYYVINAPKNGDNKYLVCDYMMPKEKSMSLYITEEPRFGNSARDLKLQLHSYPSIAFDYKINKNLIDFYNTYPTPLTEGDSYSKWGYYAMAPMSANAKATVYPAIKKAIAGKSKKEAVNIIMNMIETFKYGYDDQIWGYDRAFFPDETLYYPMSDCEDHAILLTRMVRDLLGLKTALIYYPGHLASAVCFSEPVNGDYIEHNGSKYTICDATIYYAGVGVTMRGMDNSKAVLIVVK